MKLLEISESVGSKCVAINTQTSSHLIHSSGTVKSCSTTAHVNLRALAKPFDFHQHSGIMHKHPAVVLKPKI